MLIHIYIKECSSIIRLDFDESQLEFSQDNYFQAKVLSHNINLLTI